MHNGRWPGYKAERFARVNRASVSCIETCQGSVQMSKVTEFQSSVARQVNPTLPLRLRIGFWAGILIAIAAVIRRVFALIYPPHELLTDTSHENPA